MIAAVLLICAGAIWFADWRRSRAVSSREALLARLPWKESLVISIDFAALRRAGLMELLESSKTPEEPEYKAFVSNTDFDYKQDLDLALASFGPNGKYFLLVGRFDWNKLYSYAKSQGGECANGRCQMAGSTRERKISFSPVRPEIMALAVSNDALAADWLMAASKVQQPAVTTTDPVWISFPGSVVKQSDKLPTGTAIFAKALEDAEGVVLSLGPQGQDFQANLAVTCHSAKDAEVLARELENNTNLLRSLIARENRQPNPDDLSGVLTSGAFTATDRRVAGHWPITKALVHNTLTGGS